MAFVIVPLLSSPIRVAAARGVNVTPGIWMTSLLGPATNARAGVGMESAARMSAARRIEYGGEQRRELVRCGAGHGRFARRQEIERRVELCRRVIPHPESIDAGDLAAHESGIDPAVESRATQLKFQSDAGCDLRS